mmetsp:Transcript_23516/g.72341  ORF Transcript_23516/g.72341 Transcript_23516/m.72341 type:complete len:200 (+) Transcript_23516:183-782(+)
MAAEAEAECERRRQEKMESDEVVGGFDDGEAVVDEGVEGAGAREGVGAGAAVVLLGWLEEEALFRRSVGEEEVAEGGGLVAARGREGGGSPGEQGLLEVGGGWHIFWLLVFVVLVGEPPRLREGEEAADAAEAVGAGEEEDVDAAEEDVRERGLSKGSSGLVGLGRRHCLLAAAAAPAPPPRLAAAEPRRQRRRLLGED